MVGHRDCWRIKVGWELHSVQLLKVVNKILLKLVITEIYT